MTLVNLGCGRVRHPEWVNLDVEPSGSDVRRWDVRKPLPFADRSVDMVYHSHLLEHLNSGEGRKLLQECHRILRPAGIVRVVVPDLAGIAGAYLAARGAAVRGEDSTLLEWTRMELVDQASREMSGGSMKAWLEMRSPAELARVRERAGAELDYILGPERQERRPLTLSRIRRKLRREVLRALAFLLGGRGWKAAVDEGLFRQGGEVHRTMYDDVRLVDLLRGVGFEDPRVVDAWTSGMPGFAKFGLDTLKETVRKPDSLFIEARRG